MVQLLAKSIAQTFSVAGLDAVSRALGWAIIGTLVLVVATSATSAYFLSTVMEEFFFHLIMDLISVMGLVIPLIFSSYFLAPMSVLYGLLFQNRVARAIETADYAHDRPGVGGLGVGPFLRAFRTFVGMIVIAVFAIPVSFIGTPVVGIVFYLLLTGALLGRDQFVAAASRYWPVEAAKELRRRNSRQVFLAGVAVAAMLLVPVLNLMMPVFSTILMLHLFKHLRRDLQSADIAEPTGTAHAGLAQYHR